MKLLMAEGRRRLFGTVQIDGMKNAALPILMATLLIPEACIFKNLPENLDVDAALSLLQALEVTVRKTGIHTVEVDATHARIHPLPPELVGGMRASCYLLSTLLGRFGSAELVMPGGCDFGTRPIDQHQKALSALGATVEILPEENRITATADTLTAAEIWFDTVSVGATMNAMLAAVVSEGRTILHHAAKEPHVADTANFLNACGAEIIGAGTDVITITGGRPLHGCTYCIAPDMIEAGTYLAAVAATGGDLRVKSVIPSHMESFCAKLKEMGVLVTHDMDSIRACIDEPLRPTLVTTAPYPGFPTDLQPQMGVMMCMARGTSTLREQVFAHRFRYVEELRKMGADIEVQGQTATFYGIGQLKAARVRAVDLRAGAAMLIAALAADGKSEITEITRIKRGYANYLAKLQGVGAAVWEADDM